MKTGKLSRYVVKIYTVECPLCGADVANDTTGSINFFSSEQNGRTGTCTACLTEVLLPKAIRDRES